MDQADHDLDLAVALVNTHYLLADPPDRLTDTAVVQHILEDSGDAELAGQLAPEDLPALLALRADIAPVFAAAGAEQAVGLMDPLLREASVPARLAVDDDRTVRWNWGTDLAGMSALRSRLLAALAAHLVRHGGARLGVCQADPCRCVFVDRSRARTRRYCCDQCNDRVATNAYRQRRRT